jgi:excinuclease ABC subunit B
VDDLLIEAKLAIKNGHKVLITTLTKKLAEELTTYYRSIGMKIKYLHSDIDTIERMEILRDLRMGEFDILVGINLLREGLDIPEVALVGILDADKEGFLRSTRSLIQTIGRAARNSEGKVILYGMVVTKSMQEAMKITADRRKKQDQFNQANNIAPITIKKSISGGVIEMLRKKKGSKAKDSGNMIDQELTPKELDSTISELRVKMKKAAADFDFEKAALLRDEIKALTQMRLMI